MSAPVIVTDIALALTQTEPQKDLNLEGNLVHDTGLDAEQLGELGQVGGHLVWAPTSNLLLYGKMA